VVPRAAPTAERLAVELVSFCGSGAACVSRGEAGKFAQSVGLAFFSRCFAIAALLGAVAAFPDEAKKNYELAEQLPISDPKDGQPMTLIIMSPAPLHQSDGIITQARQARPCHDPNQVRINGICRFWARHVSRAEHRCVWLNEGLCIEYYGTLKPCGPNVRCRAGGYGTLKA